MERASTFFPSGIVRVKYRGETITVPEGATIASIVSSKDGCEGGWNSPVAAVVDSRLMSLDSKVYEGADIFPVFVWDEQGELVYRRSLSVLLQAASRLVFPEVKLIVGQSLAGGNFYLWEGSPQLSEERVSKIEEKMRELVASDIPIEQERCGTARAIDIFTQAGMEDRVALLRTWWHETVRLVRIGNYIDIYHGPVAPSTGRLPYFALCYFPPGLILKYPEGKKGENPSRKIKVTKQLFDVYMETYEWNRIIGVSNIGQLNNFVIEGFIEELIRVAEGLHEKKIAHIADMVVQKNSRVVLIAGPSSSGKTTFGKRLGVQLKVNGRNPVILSIDDYYVNRENTPKDEKGEPDFESIYAVDLPLLNQHLSELLQGKEVLTPKFSFERGERQPQSKWKLMKLGSKDILMIEGIHALNDKLTASIPEKEKFKIYVSALSQLCLDDANRISTTDVRLIRRIVRDRLYRGYGAEETIAKWPSVRRGEARNIFPFQEKADIMFNSTLPYELSVLKVYAVKFLLEVAKSSPSFLEAYRLLKFLDLLVPIFPDKVPHNSIIREFIGGSFFHY